MGILAMAALVRLPGLLAARPYINYVDEGNYLHRVVHLLAHHTWDTRYYLYPTLPMYAVAGAMLLWKPAYRAFHGHGLEEDLSRDPPLAYDLLEPPDLLYCGRALALAAALAVVTLTGALARWLGGPAAGLLAAWLAALTPALVLRGAVANVDIHATAFAVAALFAGERLRRRLAGEGNGKGGGEAAAAWAGALCGLAAASKYTAGLVFLPLAATVVVNARPWRRALLLLGIAAAAAAVAMAGAMPGLVLRTRAVLRDLSTQNRLYHKIERGSYWEQISERAEWDQPFEAPEIGLPYLGLAALGLLAALGAGPSRRGGDGEREQEGREAQARARAQAQAAAGWLLLALSFALLLAPYRFRPFRNLLPLVPLLAVLVALLHGRLCAAARGTWRAAALSVAGLLLPVVLFGPALVDYARDRLALVDSRTEAVAWLARHTGADDTVLIPDELMILNGQLEALAATADVEPWGSFRRLVRSGQFRFVLLGNFALPDGQIIPRPLWRELLRHYERQAAFGEPATIAPKSLAVERPNRQAIYILRRKQASP